MKQIIQDLSLQELQQVMQNWGEKNFRAQQVFENIYLGKSFDEMSNISKELKAKLAENFEVQPITIIEDLQGKDGTQKFAYKLLDGNIIEGVLLSYKYGYTLCVSTQVGCRMGCKFCASTLNGLVRNLTAGEILAQVLVVNKLLGGNSKERKISHIVLMGSGEPLDNYENVIKFLHLVIAPEGINIAQRNISLSTCGLVDKIGMLAKEGLQIVLTISLHAPNDKIRRQTMPIANKYPITAVVNAGKRFFESTGRRVIFEYALIKDVNDSREHADELSKLVKGFPCHINVIPLNEVAERNLLTVTHKRAEQFVALLTQNGTSATVRRTMGEDIEGACGQLRNKIQKE